MRIPGLKIEQDLLSLLYRNFGLNPFTDANQNYDFRPRKGSVLIDAGVVIPGINDGQDDDSAYPLNHAPFISRSKTEHM